MLRKPLRLALLVACFASLIPLWMITFDEQKMDNQLQPSQLVELAALSALWATVAFCVSTLVSARKVRSWLFASFVIIGGFALFGLLTGSIVIGFGGTYKHWLFAYLLLPTLPGFYVSCKGLIDSLKLSDSVAENHATKNAREKEDTLSGCNEVEIR